MKMTVTYSRQAESYLAKQTERQAGRIKNAINALPAGDVKKLRGIENGYRLRVGGVRVLFKKEETAIQIVKIDNRGDVYK